MNTPLNRIRIGAVVLGVVIIFSTFGYYMLGRDPIDAAYMVVITIAGVGFSDQQTEAVSGIEKLFTMGVIIIGMAAGAYTIGGFLQLMTEGEIQRALGHHRMSEKIRQLKNHVIICGHGRIGRILTREMKRKNLPFVIIEGESDRIADAEDEGFLVLQGDATEEQVLVDAGIKDARSLVTSLPGDADNVFITLTARDLNPQIQIIARAEKHTTEKKLMRAGANRVVMPASIGASQMARMVTHPSTADLMELVSDRSMLEIELDEIEIKSSSKIVGLSVADTDANSRFRLLIVAVKPVDQEMQFNPAGDYTFQAGDTLIVMGGGDDIQGFLDEFKLV